MRTVIQFDKLHICFKHVCPLCYSVRKYDIVCDSPWSQKAKESSLSPPGATKR